MADKRIEKTKLLIKNTFLDLIKTKNIDKITVVKCLKISYN